MEVMKEYGVDGVRWYLMRAGGSLPVDSGWFTPDSAWPGLMRV